METATKTIIGVNVNVNAPVSKVWELWTNPKHIINWCFASDEWCAPSAENDLFVGGRFSTRMEAKDGSAGFDFWGIYDNVKLHQLIEYTIGDGRKVKIVFTTFENKTRISESFEAENENPVEMQEGGWQSILNNFKKYVESR